MSLKVLFLIIGLLGGPCRMRTTPTVTTVHLYLEQLQNDGISCIIDNDANTTAFLPVDGSYVEIKINSYYHINGATCRPILNNPPQSIPFTVLIKGGSTSAQFIAKKYMSAPWICEIRTNRNTQGLENTVTTADGTSYRSTDCKFNITVIDKVEDSSDTPRNATEIPLNDSNKQNWIFIGIGVVVAVVILAQTAIIVYFKSKARKMARIRRISQRASTDKEDTKRYITASAPSQQRGKIATWLSKKRCSRDDNDIYETLEELRGTGQDTPPVPPIDTIPTLIRTPLPNRVETNEDSISSDGRPALDTSSLQRRREPTPDITSLQRRPAGRQIPAEVDISKRPRLPLPTEIEPEETLPTPNTMRKRLPTPQSEVLKPGPSNIPPKPKPGHIPSAIVNELDNKLKMRVSVAAKEGSPKIRTTEKPGFAKRVSFMKWNSQKTDVLHNVPNPDPMPTGKSAVLLGLSPPPKPVKPLVLPKTLTPDPHAPTPRPKPKLTQPPPTLPKNPSILPQTPTTLPKNRAALPQASSILPSPAVLPKAPSALPKTSSVFAQALAALPQSATGLPKGPVDSASLPRPKPALHKPSTPAPISARPAIKPTVPNVNPAPAAVFKPPLPPPSNVPIEEPLYEEYNEASHDLPEEAIYDTDDEEWTYEPLNKYNLYSA